ncbi:MAG: peptidyl-prolyl cis-trans isomerase [Planctomycetes bacterium]|nr:peptidyl-prolyl cis-trans isomerase [Planctomycetota bacterium]
MARLRRRAFLFLTLLLLAAAPAGEPAADGGAQPVPMARFRVALPPNGGRAALRESTVSSAPIPDLSLPDPADTVAEAETTESAAAPTAVLAVVHGRTITEEDITRELLARRGRETLEWIISREIIEHELARWDLLVTEEEVADRLAEHLAGYAASFPHLSRPDDLTRAAAGMRLDEYRERAVWAELALRKIMRLTLPPSEEELRRYYAEKQAAFVQPEQVRISQIFIAPEPETADGVVEDGDWQRAERRIHEAHTRLRAGEDFAAIADAYGSGGHRSRWVGRGELLRELEEPAFSIGTGSNTTPIKSSIGYHILRVENRRERTVPSFDAVREDVLAGYEDVQFAHWAGDFMGRLLHEAVRSGNLRRAPDDGTLLAEP